MAPAAAAYEDAVAVVPQVSLEVSGRNPAEGKGRAVGEAQGVDRGGDLPAEGYQARLPTELNALRLQLLGEARPVGRAGHEDVQVLLLELAGNPCRRLRVGGRADDGGKARSRPIHELDPALAHDHVAGCAEPDTVSRVRADQGLAGLDGLESE